jgi:hypothetical protein
MLTVDYQLPSDKTIECPTCKLQMEEGIIDRGLWTKRTGMFKLSQKISKNFGFINYKPVISYLCPRCKKIELYLEK